MVDQNVNSVDSYISSSGFSQPIFSVNMEAKSVHDYYRFLRLKWVGPLYYNYPDGEDLPGKLSFCGQVGLFISAPMGILNAYVCHPYPTSQMGRFLRILRAVIPGVGMGLAFAAGTYYATNFRKKDDAFNHAIGGLAAGTIFGAVNGFHSGAYVSIICAALAVTIKNSSEVIKARRNTVPKTYSPYIMRSKDLRGYSDKGDNWVKAPPPEN